MRVITALADRLLGAIVPRTTAGACGPCEPENIWRICSCTNHVHYESQAYARSGISCPPCPWGPCIKRGTC